MLWDVEVADRCAGGLEKCSWGALRSLGLKVIEETPGLFGRPLEEVFTPATVALFRAAVAEFGAVPGPLSETPEPWEELLADAWDWQDGNAPFTAASLVQGLVQYSEFLVGEGHPDDILEVLSSCYESVLSYASIGRTVTIDQERDNSYCRAAIDLQHRLIREHCPLG
ncbi:hypothetical protein [Streptomyces sp. NPDC049590]|uniref:hypothetical protein n=1 Tax=Streptomyces sp. NPDC049590 TaxID=3154834 RepID=UPI003437C96E